MAIEKNHELHYNLNNYDNYIIETRLKKSRISTILKYIVPRIPLDPIVILSHILNILNNQNLAVSRKEVRTALNYFYKKSEHGDKQSYLNYLYRTFKVKEGTITCPSNFRKNTNSKTCDIKKRAISVMSEGNKPPISHFNTQNHSTLHRTIKTAVRMEKSAENTKKEVTGIKTLTLNSQLNEGDKNASD